MFALRRCLLALIVAVAGACGGVPATSPSGPAGSATPNGSTAPSSGPGFEAFRDGIAAIAAQPVGNIEVRREALITAMGLRESLGSEADQILAVVAAAEEAARAKVPARGDVPRGTIVYAMAILPALPVTPVPPPNNEMREFLRVFLDDVGRGGAESMTMGPDTLTATATAGGMNGTTTMTTTYVASIRGSVARLEIKREVHSAVTDSSGATVYDETRNYRITGEINVCPSSAGIATASINNSIDADASTFAGSAGRVGSHATGNLTSASTFQGRVDDQASLGGVTQDYSHDETWRRTASAEGGPEAVHEGAVAVKASGIEAGVPVTREWALTPGDYSDATGTAEMSGDATQNMINSTVLSAADDYTTIDLSFVEAERLWRHGRCAMVTAPGYDAETQIETNLQDVVSHTEEVDKGSTTEFEVNLKHRFGDSLTASISADLINGKETLTPASIDTPPGTLIYEAPDEDGKDATVKLVTTSKQGIGTLVLAFHTGAKKLKVTIDGRLTSGGLGISFVTKVSVKGVVLSKLEDGTYAGTGPATASVTIGGVCPTPITEKGTIRLTARREEVEDQSLPRRWYVKWETMTQVTTSGTCRGYDIGSLIQAGEAGYTGMFMTVLGDFEFNEEGGEKQVKRSMAFGKMSNTIDATVKGEIVSESGP